MSGRHGKQLYLHIGRHKCGTSTLQHFLCGSESPLAEHGFVYPHAFREPVAHHPVAHFYNRHAGGPAGNGTDAEAIEAFWHDLPEAGKAIVSSEAFQNLDPDWLRQDLSGFDLTVVIYLREPLDYLLSAYAQRVKGGGGTETLDAFIERFQPDYRQFLTGWRTAFPDATLCVRAFERGRLVGQDIRRDFLYCLGLSTEEMAGFDFPDSDSNISIGGPLLEFMRRLNGYGRPDAGIRYALYRACQDLAGRYPDYRQRPALPQAVQQAVRARHADSLAWLAETYFGGVDPFEKKRFPEGAIEHSLSGEALDTLWLRLREHHPKVADHLDARLGNRAVLCDGPSAC